jgi:hypothetical protein
MVLGVRNPQSIACEVWSLCFPGFCCKLPLIAVIAAHCRFPRVLPSSRRHCRSTVPSAPPPSSCAPSYFPRPSNRSCPFPRPYRTFTCHLLSRPGFCRRRSWAAAAAAARPHHAPTPARSLAQLRPPPGPRWAHGRAPPLPRLGAQPARWNSAGAATSPWPRPWLQAPK